MSPQELPGAVQVHLAAAAPEPALYLVLVHDGPGVAVGQAMLVGQPVSTFLAAGERRSGLKSMEPLSEFASCDDRDAGNEVLVHFRRVGQ